MLTLKQAKLLFLIAFALTLFIFLDKSFGLGNPSLYYKNFVRHANWELCTHKTPTATFTAYLNRDQSKILIENAPRQDGSSDPNIDGRGVFGVDLANFIDPAASIGDSVFVRFTCNATQQQGVLADSIYGVPWIRFPQTLYLSPIVLPLPPQNVTVITDENSNRVIRWTQNLAETYSIYRRCLQDTLTKGNARMLYHRIAENFSLDTFVDSSVAADKNYAYILYATSANGTISSHSSEAIENQQISSLSVIPLATTVILSWNAFQTDQHPITGYNIYRRTVNTPYGSAIAYTGMDTSYIDSRLQLSKTYYYKIKARLDHQTEVAESPEMEVTTLDSQQGLYTYANLKIAVVIYKRTNAGNISSSEVEKIRIMLNEGRSFYWRNSGMKLNVDFTYFLIDKYVNFGDPDNTNVSQTVNDLRELGVMNTQYDIIFRITPAVNGYWSYGVMDLNLPGPARQTGFSHSDWPVGTGVKYPAFTEGINYGLTWIFVHEVQHAIDALYHANGHPEMYHGDVPWEFPVACGEHFDFQAKMFRAFQAYENLLANWGDRYETADADQDGFPDADPIVPLDEMRFGSRIGLSDSDFDGLTDKAEAMAGSYCGSNPNATDTDNDGVFDGDDDYPRFPVNHSIPYFKPNVDGRVDSCWSANNDTVSFTHAGYAPKLFLAYDEDSLYLALYLERSSIPEIYLDFHGDGWWHSSGNTYIRINPWDKKFYEFRSWDASEEVKNFSLASGGAGGMWDDEPLYRQQFSRRVIDPAKVNLKVQMESSTVQIELAIPKNSYAGINLNEGDQIGLNINYSHVNNDWQQWATTFDLYNFVYLKLAEKSEVLLTRANSMVITDFGLSQNYPNPFNRTTTIRYTLPIPGFVILKVFNLLGQEIAILTADNYLPGEYAIQWQAINLPGGVYIYQLQVRIIEARQPAVFVETKKFILLK